MFKFLRLLALFAFLIVALVPATPTQAAPPIPCDGMLFTHAAYTAIQGDPAPIISPNFQEYIVFDTSYAVRYRLYYSPAYNEGIFEMYQGKNLIAKAINATWKVCTPGNRWRNYLIGHGFHP